MCSPAGNKPRNGGDRRMIVDTATIIDPREIGHDRRNAFACTFADLHDGCDQQRQRGPRRRDEREDVDGLQARRLTQVVRSVAIPAQA